MEKSFSENNIYCNWNMICLALELANYTVDGKKYI